ncbi:MAG TPA: terminase small subunit [Bacteroidales bacterium]|nr:terminase small subunit [Bacteroidales bacterium]
MAMDLTRKERFFALEYLADGKLNPERAAVRAGYSESVARTKAYLWVTEGENNPKPHITEYIQKQIKNREVNLRKEFERLDKELTRVSYSDIGLIIIQMGGEISIEKLKDVDPDLRAAIASITVTDKGARITMHNKNKAIELKGKLYGMWNSKEDDSLFMPKVIRGEGYE